MLNIVGIIPARMASARLPGKPLAKISGKAMIYHVYQRSKRARVLKDLYVATCDKEIKTYCAENGMKVIMTRDTHERASDRACEAMLTIEKMTKTKIDILVMIQGDEPMVRSQMIEKSVKPILEDKTIQVVNLMAPLKSNEEREDINTVKVAVDKNNFALYFSRKGISMHKQIAIIPFRRDFLIKFNEFPQTPLEIAESVDMLRVLEHGCKVKMVASPLNTYTVDTPEDLERVKKIMETEK